MPLVAVAIITVLNGCILWCRDRAATTFGPNDDRQKRRKMLDDCQGRRPIYVRICDTDAGAIARTQNEIIAFLYVVFVCSCEKTSDEDHGEMEFRTRWIRISRCREGSRHSGSSTPNGLVKSFTFLPSRTDEPDRTLKIQLFLDTLFNGEILIHPREVTRFTADGSG
jgi:hypothetical protein